jgi:archaellum component FlaC
MTQEQLDKLDFLKKKIYELEMLLEMCNTQLNNLKEDCDHKWTDGRTSILNCRCTICDRWT